MGVSVSLLDKFFRAAKAPPLQRDDETPGQQRHERSELPPARAGAVTGLHQPPQGVAAPAQGQHFTREADFMLRDEPKRSASVPGRNGAVQ